MHEIGEEIAKRVSPIRPGIDDELQESLLGPRGPDIVHTFGIRREFAVRIPHRTPRSISSTWKPSVP